MGTEVDASWLTLDLSMPDSSNPGGTVGLTILRPPEWLLQVQAEVGRLVPIEVPELGLEGMARVHGIRGPPTIQPGPGRVVLMTISRDHEELLSVELQGAEEPLEVTSNHLLYSQQRGEWVEAREVLAGETLMTPGGSASVASVRPEPGRYRVFNLEVEAEHEYYVSQAGVRAHNTCPCLRAVSEARPVNKILGDAFPKGGAKVLKDVFSGDVPLDTIPEGLRRELAASFLKTARANPVGSGQRLFNEARAKFLRGRGPSPGNSGPEFAERAGVEFFRKK